MMGIAGPGGILARTGLSSPGISGDFDQDDSFVDDVVRGAVTSERQGACREVADAHGHKWRVRELEMSEGDGSVARKSLIALHEMVIRRFWSFPAGWRELSDPALLALIDGPAQPHPEARSDGE